MREQIKPVTKYPGAKWRMAASIIQHFPAHTHYLEPFFGSGAVLFCKPPGGHEVVNDLSGDVVNLFRVIRDSGEQLAALIEMTPYSRDEYLLSNHLSDTPLEQARRFLVRVWQSHGGRGAGLSVGWWHLTVGDRHMLPVQSWVHLPQRIRAVVDRLRMVEIENQPALAIIPSFNTSDCLIYADPPYPQSTRNGRMYKEDSMTDTDHMALLSALDAHRGPVVLSGYHCPLYDTRLHHWHAKEYQMAAEKGNSRIEVLWLNQECVDRLGYGPLFDQVMP